MFPRYTVVAVISSSPNEVSSGLKASVSSIYSYFFGSSIALVILRSGTSPNIDSGVGLTQLRSIFRTVRFSSMRSTCPSQFYLRSRAIIMMSVYAYRINKCLRNKGEAVLAKMPSPLTQNTGSSTVLTVEEEVICAERLIFQEKKRVCCWKGRVESSNDPD